MKSRCCRVVATKLVSMWSGYKIQKSVSVSIEPDSLQAANVIGIADLQYNRVPLLLLGLVPQLLELGGRVVASSEDKNVVLHSVVDAPLGSADIHHSALVHECVDPNNSLGPFGVKETHSHRSIMRIQRDGTAAGAPRSPS